MNVVGTPYFTRMRQALRLQFRNQPTEGVPLKALFAFYGVITIFGGGYRAIQWMELQPGTPVQAVGYVVLMLIAGYATLVMTLFTLKVLWYHFFE